MMFWNFLTIISLVISIIAIILTYYVWKNPTDISTKKKKIFNTRDAIYKFGVNNKGWFVLKVIEDNIEKGEPFQFVADKKNNPGLKKIEDNVEEFKKLNYREY
jgi:hypothetical protein